jgi:hypothetical protein
MGTLSDIGIQEDELAVVESKTRRDEVFDLIDGERGYQLRRWGLMGEDGNLHDPEKSVADWLVYMKHHLDRAFAELTTNPGTIEALEQVRKVTALGVACMEQYQTPARRERMVENLRSGNIT